MDSDVICELKKISGLPKMKVLYLLEYGQDEIIYLRKKQVSLRTLNCLKEFCSENNLLLTEKTNSYLVSTWAIE